MAVREWLGKHGVLALSESESGTLWIGTLAGLTRWREDRFFQFTKVHGLDLPVVNQIVPDGRGSLWLGTHQGVVRVRIDELNAVAEGRLPRVRCLRLSKSDGLPSSETNGEVQPAGCRTPDGRLWFPTTHGVAIVDPAVLGEPNPPDPVAIETLRATALLLSNPAIPGAAPTAWPRAQSLGSGPVRLPAGSGRFIEFRYISVNLAAPEGTRYRYRLDGHDPDWVDAGPQRTASYANLGPGQYRFRVTAADPHGGWSGEETGLGFIVLPHWYETLWLRLVAVASLVTAVVGIHRRRVAARVRFERLASENRLARERSRISRDLHDDLGAWLARAQMLLSRLHAREPGTPGEWSARLREVEESVRAGQQTMREVIWAANPDNDTLEGLGSRIAVFAREYLEPLGVRCRLDLPEVWPAARLRADLRQGLSRMIKEAVRNAVEHGHASEVRFSLSAESGLLKLAVADDGCGLPESTGGPAESGEQPSEPALGSPRGSGLESIRLRVEGFGGRLVLAGNPAGGTTLILHVPLSP